MKFCNKAPQSPAGKRCAFLARLSVFFDYLNAIMKLIWMVIMMMATST